MLLKQRYKSNFWLYSDYTSTYLMSVWFYSLNFFCSNYVITTKESKLERFINYIFKGPPSLIFCIILLPFGVLGFILWIVTCIYGKPASYAYWEIPINEQVDYQTNSMKNIFTISTANLCLLPEFLSKFNNNFSPYKRALQIATRILTGCTKNNINKEKNSISTDFSHLDFICLQEVWERTTAKNLISVLKLEFNYFLYDAGEFLWSSNLYCLNSGLMFASKYPIIDVSFKGFRDKTIQNRASSLGLLLVKVALNKDENCRKVGYIATTHLQSYQGVKPCLLSQLDEAIVWLAEFRNDTKESRDLICFDIFCGDFNFDNLSPGDRKCSQHCLFDKYVDPCRVTAGEDTSWSLGTEMRQLMLWDNNINSPENFKKALQDPVLRRCYILDADVEIQTIKLQFLKVPYDENGELKFNPVGGKRRIDYLLYRNDIPLDIVQYSFITALNQLTDHIPISMTFKTQQ